MRANERSERPSGPLKTRLSVTRNAPNVVNGSHYDLRDDAGRKDIINDRATAAGGVADEAFDPKWYCNYTFDFPHEEVWLHGYGGEGDDVAKKK